MKNKRCKGYKIKTSTRSKMNALTLELEQNICYEIYRCQITDTYLLIFIMDMLFLVISYLVFLLRTVTRNPDFFLTTYPKY